MDLTAFPKALRITAVLAALVLLAWAGVALAMALCSGFSEASLLAGVKAVPKLAADLFAPKEDSFRGLPNIAATSVLRRGFGHGVSASDGRMLYDLLVKRGYRRVLDVGTARGYAALWFGMAMRETGGKVITIEIDPAVAQRARENIRQAGLEDVIESRINDALIEVPATRGDFDFVFLDLGGPHHRELLDLLYPRLTRGGAIVSHNAYLLRFTGDDYLATVCNKADMETRILPTLSGGIAVSVKRSSSAP